jgi:hypothetical protein
MHRGEGIKDLSPPRRAIAIVLFALSLGIVATAQRDIQRRTDSEVRGNSFVWRLVALNAVGALAYLRWGRAPAAS